MHFDEYVHAQRPTLLRFATVLTGQLWLADDLVSDALGRAYERWDRIGSLDHPHAYVRRMVLTDFLSWRRRTRRTTPSDDLEDRTPEIPDGTEQHAERDAMIARLDRLPDKQRAAVVLRFYLGLSDEEIAAELHCRPSTVRSQVSRALATLRIHTTDSPGPRAVHRLETR